MTTTIDPECRHEIDARRPRVHGILGRQDPFTIDAHKIPHKPPVGGLNKSELRRFYREFEGLVVVYRRIAPSNVSKRNLYGKDTLPTVPDRERKFTTIGNVTKTEIKTLYNVGTKQGKFILRNTFASAKATPITTVKKKPTIQLPFPVRESRIPDISSMSRPPDWDGLGAKAISRTACQASVSFLDRASSLGIPQPKFVTPSPLGGIAFQWNTNGHRLKVRVFGEGPEECSFQWIQLPDAVKEGKGDIDTVLDSLSGFFGKA